MEAHVENRSGKANLVNGPHIKYTFFQHTKAEGLEVMYVAL